MNWEKIIEKFFEGIVDFIMSFGLKLVVALLVLAIGFKVSKWLIGMLAKGKGFSKIEPGAQTFIKSFLNIVLKALVILTAASILGVPMTNFVTAIGSIGLAIGLAMQGSLSNVAGGLMILMFHPFKVGDFIKASDVSGTVKEITILYTLIDTGDNVRVVVPNGELSNATVENYSFNDIRRCDMEFGISYDSDARTAVKVLTELGRSHELVLKDKDVFVKVASYDDSQITIKMRVWTNASDYWTVYFDIMDKANDVFAANSIEMPYPQLDVHVDNKN